MLFSSAFEGEGALLIIWSFEIHMAKVLDAKLYDKAKRIQQLGNDPITDGNQQVIKVKPHIAKFLHCFLFILWIS